MAVHQHLVFAQQLGWGCGFIRGLQAGRLRPWADARVQLRWGPASAVEGSGGRWHVGDAYVVRLPPSCTVLKPFRQHLRCTACNLQCVLTSETCHVGLSWLPSASCVVQQLENNRVLAGLCLPRAQA